jgi:hypothetical protein
MRDSDILKKHLLSLGSCPSRTEMILLKMVRGDTNHGEGFAKKNADSLTLVENFKKSITTLLLYYKLKA